MALTICEECGKQISTNAATCPHCGNRVKRRSSQQLKTGCVVLVIIFGIALIAALLNTLE